MHGQVLQSQAPGALIAHNLGTATFCAFLIQDRTAGGVALPAQDAWVDTKVAGSFTLNDNTGGGPGVYSLYVCTPHSVIDAGPIVTAFGAATSTRTAALTRRSAAPSYRSLHTNVAFVNGAGAPGGGGDDVTIVHNLGTTNVLVFVSPITSPVDTGAAGSVSRVFLQAIVDLNTITLRSRKDVGGNFTGASPCSWDVMVVAAPTVGHSVVFPPHRATAGANVGLPSYDYSGADVARAVLGVRASYWAGYTNVDTLGLVGAAPVDLVHNLRGAALMALVGGPSTAASPGILHPYIQARDQGALGTTIRLAEIGGAGPLNNNQVLVIRSHSKINLQ